MYVFDGMRLFETEIVVGSVSVCDEGIIEVIVFQSPAMFVESFFEGSTGLTNILSITP